MSIQFTCPICSHVHNADPSLAGKKARCRCGAILDIPTLHANVDSSERYFAECPACSRRLSYRLDQAGKKAKCACGQLMVLPTPVLEAKVSRESSPSPSAKPKPAAASVSPSTSNQPAYAFASPPASTWAGAANWIAPAIPQTQSLKPHPQVESEHEYGTIPGSLVIIGVLDVAYALFMLAAALVCALGGSFLSSLNMIGVDRLGAWWLILGVFYFVMAVVYGVSAFFALTPNRIGWRFIATLHAFGLTYSFFTLFTKSISFTLDSLFIFQLGSVIYAGWVMYALFQDDIKERYGRQQALKPAILSVGIPGLVLGGLLALVFFLSGRFVNQAQDFDDFGDPAWPPKGANEPDWDAMNEEEFRDLIGR